MQSQVCYGCGRQVPPGNFSCLHCGGDELGTEARISFDDLDDESPPQLPAPWQLLTWPPGVVGLLSGAPGSGKSSLGALLDPDHDLHL